MSLPVAVLEAELARGRAAGEHLVEHPPAGRQVIGMDDRRSADAPRSSGRLTSEHAREGGVALDDLDRCRRQWRGSRACRRAPSRRPSRRARGPRRARAASRSRSVTSSETPPRPTISPLVSRTGNLSDQKWRVCAGAGIRDELLEATWPRRPAHDLGGRVRRMLLEHQSGAKASAIVPAGELLGGLADERARLGVGHHPALLAVAQVDRDRAVVEDAWNCALASANWALASASSSSAIYWAVMSREVIVAPTTCPSRPTGLNVDS